MRDDKLTEALDRPKETGWYYATIQTQRYLMWFSVVSGWYSGIAGVHIDESQKAVVGPFVGPITEDAWNRRTPAETVSREAIDLDKLERFDRTSIIEPMTYTFKGRWVKFEDVERLVNALPAPQPVSTGEGCQGVFEKRAKVWFCTFEKSESGEYKDHRTFYIYSGWKEAWSYLASRAPVPSPGKCDNCGGEIPSEVRCDYCGHGNPVPSVVGVPSVAMPASMIGRLVEFLTYLGDDSGEAPDTLETTRSLLADLALLTRQPDMGGKP